MSNHDPNDEPYLTASRGTNVSLTQSQLEGTPGYRSAQPVLSPMAQAAEDLNASIRRAEAALLKRFGPTEGHVSVDDDTILRWDGKLFLCFDGFSQGLTTCSIEKRRRAVSKLPALAGVLHGKVRLPEVEAAIRACEDFCKSLEKEVAP